MNKIEVAVINEASYRPGDIMMFLAKLTQRGHKIKDMHSLWDLYTKSGYSEDILMNVSKLPHGTIKRFTPITIAVVGASRRFLAQARTHQVGMDFVSASLQYSDYSGKADFVVPYGLTEEQKESYMEACTYALREYEKMIENGIDRDSAGYVMPQGLRNILIIQANHQAWENFIRTRVCRRNTPETQYVTLLIWEALLATSEGTALFSHLGADCLQVGGCREGGFSCGKPLSTNNPTILRKELFPW